LSILDLGGTWNPYHAPNKSDDDLPLHEELRACVQRSANKSCHYQPDGRKQQGLPDITLAAAGIKSGRHGTTIKRFGLLEVLKDQALLHGCQEFLGIDE
jgi:hypothetical protein